MNLNPMQIALGLISRNPQIANNPQAQQYIDVIRNNDEQQGRTIAQNICNAYGITPDQAIKQARQFFGIPR